MYIHKYIYCKSAASYFALSSWLTQNYLVDALAFAILLLLIKITSHFFYDANVFPSLFQSITNFLRLAVQKIVCSTRSPDNNIGFLSTLKHPHNPKTQ